MYQPQPRLGVITMYDFKVQWEIDAFDEDGPIGAAKFAQRMQQQNREGYDCSVFIVTDEKGNRFRIDLNDPGCEAEPM